MALVVDDHLLLDLLTETHPPWLDDEVERSAVYTTGSWYYRVALAMTRGPGMARCRAGLPPTEPAHRRSAPPRWSPTISACRTDSFDFRSTRRD